MIRLATIGSGWICDQFIEAAKLSGEFELKAVYSRTEEKAKTYAAKHSAELYFTDVDVLAESNEIDAVYVASPNVLHASQAKRLLESGKHVICEKPMATRKSDVIELFEVAEQNRVVLFEAFVSPYLPNFKLLKERMAEIGTLHKAYITYCQYSSKYPALLAGELPNIFNPAMGTGSIMDIGYYCVGAAAELFGEPLSLQASANLLPTGVDGNGSVILNYEGFDVVLTHAKTHDSYLASEFQGEDGTIQVPLISLASGLDFYPKGQEKQDWSVEQHLNPMYYEALAFAEQVKNGTIDANDKTRTLIIASLLDEIRRQTGVKFPFDAE